MEIGIRTRKFQDGEKIVVLKDADKFLVSEGLTEHCDLIECPVSDLRAGVLYFWLDGDFIAFAN